MAVWRKKEWLATSIPIYLICHCGISWWRANINHDQHSAYQWRQYGHDTVQSSVSCDEVDKRRNGMGDVALMKMAAFCEMHHDKCILGVAINALPVVHQRLKPWYNWFFISCYIFDVFSQCLHGPQHHWRPFRDVFFNSRNGTFFKFYIRSAILLLWQTPQ